MARTIAFFKPYGVLSQFTDTSGRPTLRDFIDIPGMYSAGRLDYRSEGLLILSDDGTILHRLTDPIHEHPKTYYAQVEGQASAEAVAQLNNSIVLPGFQLKVAFAEMIGEPALPMRDKPVRSYHPTTWLKIILREGKKHQVRRMTAAIGFPTLRLVRYAVGRITLDGLQPGEWRDLDPNEIAAILSEQ